MTIDERIALCRFLIKIEGQEAYCASIGVRDTSKFRGKAIAKKSRTVKLSEAAEKQD